MSHQNDKEKQPNHKKTPKQIGALICVFLLVGMYIGAFIVSCLDLGDSGRLFAGCLVATIGVPLLLWLFLWCLERMKKSPSESSESE